MEKFYLGMDIGTDSVGMACTDEQYNLLRAKGKDLWAVRLFNEAQDASARRAKRTARRRLQRRRQRIEFLQGIFAPFMADELFFLRLNNSGFFAEDKDPELQTKFSLFADDGYTDVDFYREYPTIFHLREALMKTPCGDLRLYYLALHHILKYRGHFLFEGEDMSGIRDITHLFRAYNDAVAELGMDVDISIAEDKAEEFRALATSRLTQTEKKRKAAELFHAKTAELKEILALLVGSSASPKKMFGEEYAEKYKEEKSLSFRDLNDEAFEALSGTMEDHFEALCAARAIYNFTVFEKVLDGKENVSQAMTALYEKHKTDLRLLKDFVKANYAQETYYKIFRSIKESANYVNYVGYTKQKNKKKPVKKCGADAFFKFLVKTLKEGNPQDSQTLAYIQAEIENRTFLPKILNADNGLFPHQINGMELDLILINLQKAYPEFAKKDGDGYSPAEKIKKIFLFKIPYYVGPLNTAHENGGKGNSWMKRKAEGKITPWNFDEMVDAFASNERFIRRMTNKCTYLHNQDVLPKGSMYYQAFDTLNQLNRLTIGSVPISVELKREIFHNVYLKNKKVGVKQIEGYLIRSGKCTKEELKERALGGFDVESGLKANMSAYVTFKGKFGDFVDEKPEIFENIIFWHTLNTDKHLVERMILEKYGTEPIIKENVVWLKSLTAFKEFGRLSKKLLCGISGGVDAVTGEIYTILRQLYYTNDNFNQLLGVGNYSFAAAIHAENAGESAEITYEDVADLYVSPMVRRGIWQSLQMVDEYVKAVGRAPDKIFVEVTRHDAEKKRTVSRKGKLFELYKGVGADCADIDELMRELNRAETTDARLRQERLYLYFLQLGRCAYTGERIQLDQLSGELYDVDHILPQSMTKDDSLDNKVLVKRVKNEEKSDKYPLPVGFTNQQGFWKILRAKGLMSETKYARLTRTQPLSDEDFRAFVNRQIVITNQAAKAVAELLKRKYEGMGTKIVYSKATNVNDFKQKYAIVKCRETNDLHHARDAYLNIVVGNVYDTKFTSAYDYYYRKQDDFWREYNLKHLFDKPVQNAWAGKDDIGRIKKIVAKTSMSVTRYAFTNMGEFYDQTVYGKEDGGISVPRKNSFPYNQTEKYGGYKSLSTAYFVIVESKNKKGNLIKTIEAIPVLVEYNCRGAKDGLIRYLKESGLVEPRILVPKLKIRTLISVNGYKTWIAGVTGTQILIHNAQQWFTDVATDLYVKNLVKLCEWDRNGRIAEIDRQNEKFVMVANRKKEELVVDREKNVLLYQRIIEQLKKKMYQGLSAARSFALKLEDKITIFNALTVLEQAKVLLQIVRFMKCNAECADLKLLNDGATCGKLLISKNITDVDFSIIHQSPCGLVEYVQKV